MSFGPDAVMVRRYGNAFAATMFLQGLAVEELDTSDLEPIDRALPGHRLGACAKAP